MYFNRILACFHTISPVIMNQGSLILTTIMSHLVTELLLFVSRCYVDCAIIVAFDCAVDQAAPFTCLLLLAAFLVVVLSEILCHGVVNQSHS